MEVYISTQIVFNNLYLFSYSSFMIVCETQALYVP